MNYWTVLMLAALGAVVLAMAGTIMAIVILYRLSQFIGILHMLRGNYASMTCPNCHQTLTGLTTHIFHPRDLR